MKNVLKASAVLSTGSAVTIVVGIGLSKLLAIVVGPDGVGLFSLIQSFLSIAGIILSLGVGAALVRHGAVAVGRENTEELAGFWSGSWLLFWISCIVVIPVLFWLRSDLARIVFGNSTDTGPVVVAILALPFVVSSGLFISLVNAHNDVSRITRIKIVGSVLAGVSSAAIVVGFSEEGIPFAVASGHVLGWVVAFTLARFRSPEVKWTIASVRSSLVLLRFGISVTASSLAGAGVLLLLPFVVLALFDEQNVGFVRAATTISTSYIGFLLIAMSHDYFPRLSAVSDDKSERNRIINLQIEAMLLVAMPLILLTLAGAPLAMPILYSAEFEPAVSILQWQLVGDVFKLASWSLSYSLLAAALTGSYLFTEVVGGAVMLIVTVAMLNAVGIAGYGMAYAASYAFYLALSFVVAKRRNGFSMDSRNWRRIALGGCSVLVARLAIEWLSPAVGYLAAVTLGGIFFVDSIRRSRSAFRSGEASY